MCVSTAKAVMYIGKLTRKLSKNVNLTANKNLHLVFNKEGNPLGPKILKITKLGMLCTEISIWYLSLGIKKPFVSIYTHFYLWA